MSVLAALLILALQLPLSDLAVGANSKPFKKDSLRVVGIVLGLHLGVSLARRRSGSGGAGPHSDWRLVHSTLLSASLLLAFLHGLLGDMAWKAMFAVLPLFAATIAAFYRSIENSRVAAALCGATCLAIAISCYTARWNYVFGEASVSKLSAETEASPNT